MVKCPYCGCPNIVNISKIELLMAEHGECPVSIACEHCKLISNLKLEIVAKKNKGGEYVES